MMKPRKIHKLPARGDVGGMLEWLQREGRAQAKEIDELLKDGSLRPTEALVAWKLTSIRTLLEQTLHVVTAIYERLDKEERR